MAVSKGKIRIGIDVGGTFTHAVAIDGQSVSLIGKAKVPTTHKALEGVAKGIVQALEILLAENKIAASDVSFIAHSTTQATNALLEGDVATVGILGMGRGPEAWLAASATQIGKLELAPGKFLITHHRFLDTSKPPSEETLRKLLAELVEAGAKAIAISEAFSPDSPGNEEAATAVARSMNLYVTCGSEVSQLYGLKVRTRTAAINASMLPKMIESANLTEESVRKVGIKAPLMIMRSDGGVMDIDSMRRKPILTMLSGPAAGVAAAMMFLRISDGIFMEVGGTSTDISAIKNGRAQLRNAAVAGHKIYMRTLDVRTVGVAGGSLPRISVSNVTDVGPRSAHIADLKYICFEKPLADPKSMKVSPVKDDPDDYLVFQDGDDESQRYALTPTCAANYLQLVPEGNCAVGDRQAVEAALKVLTPVYGNTPSDVAESICHVATDHVIPVVKDLIEDYKLDQETLLLVGGGGGACAIAPYTAKRLNAQHMIAKETDVVSAIGVALALLRESIERQIANPTSEQILNLREEAHHLVEKMGADPKAIEVHIEIDAAKGTVTATASGALSMTDKITDERELSERDRLELAATSMRLKPDCVSSTLQNKYFQVFAGKTYKSTFFGLLKEERAPIRVLDSRGNIRVQCVNGKIISAPVKQAEAAAAKLAEENASWGDAGKVIPGIVLFAGPRIVDLSGLLNVEQVVSVARAELTDASYGEDVLVLAKL